MLNYFDSGKVGVSVPFIRCKYSKLDRVKYLSHLDIIRTLQRSLRRAGLPVSYTKGYNPHPRIIFGPALVVGATSDGEYVDIELQKHMETEKFKGSLNYSLPRGLCVSKCGYLLKKQDNIMSICKAAHYYFAFEVDEKANCCDYSLEHADVVKATLISALDRICARKSIVIQRTTKKGNKQIDIRPLIYSIEKPVMHGREIGIESILSVGNKGSVRPEEIFRILSEFAGIKLYPTGIHRKELLIEQDGKLVPPFLEN